MEKLTTFRELWGSNPSRKLGDPHKLGVSKCSSGVFSETTSDLSGLPQVREESRTLNFSESNRPGFYSYTVLRSGCSSCLSAKSLWGRVCNFFPGRLPTSLSSTDAFGREVAPESVLGTPSSGWLSRSGWARTFPGSLRSPFPSRVVGSRWGVGILAADSCRARRAEAHVVPRPPVIIYAQGARIC